jgi:hypothetical protein
MLLLLLLLVVQKVTYAARGATLWCLHLWFHLSMSIDLCIFHPYLDGQRGRAQQIAPLK